MAPHSSTLAWKIPWAEEPDGLQSMGSLRVGHDWETSLSLFTFMHWRRKWQPTPVFLPGESQGRGSLVGCPLWGHTESHRVAQGTRLMPLSSSSIHEITAFTVQVFVSIYKSYCVLEAKILLYFLLLVYFTFCFLKLDGLEYVSVVWFSLVLDYMLLRFNGEIIC